jgi:hypothetical protein
MAACIQYLLIHLHQLKQEDLCFIKQQEDSFSSGNQKSILWKDRIRHRKAGRGPGRIRKPEHSVFSLK